MRLFGKTRKNDPVSDDIRRRLSIIDFQEYGRAISTATTVDEIQAAVDVYQRRERDLFPNGETIPGFVQRDTGPEGDES